MNVKNPAITIWPDGTIYLSHSVRATLGSTCKFFVHGKKIRVVKGNGAMFYDNGCCCSSVLAKLLGVAEKCTIPLVKMESEWIGIL